MRNSLTPTVARPGHPGLWAMLSLVGQVASLRLVEAGSNVSYQHHLPFNALWTAGPRWAIAALAVECLALLFTAPHWWPVAMTWIAARPWSRVGAIVAFIATSATISRSVGQYAGELLWASLLQGMHLAVVMMFAMSLTPTTRLRAMLAAPAHGRETTGTDRVALLAAAWVTLVTAVLAFAVYDRHPHVPDEVAYLLQAKMIARGLLSLPAPPVPAAFDVDLMMIRDGRWFSVMPSGWSFVLALGVAARIPWLVNPVLAGACVLLAHRVAQHFVSRQAARLTVLLLATSPWFLFMGMSLMSHTVSLLLALIATHAAGTLQQRPRVLTAAACGVATGLVAINRPLEGVAFAGLMGLWLITGLRGGARIRLLSVLVAVTGVTASLTLAYNRALSGSARVFPVTAYMDETYGAGKNDLGFGANRGLGWTGLDPFPGHNALDVIINANLNVTQVNIELLGWSTGSLLLVLVLLCSGRLTRGDRQLLIAILAIVGIHSFYWFSGGPDFGARYWYLCILPLIVLSARGIEVLYEEAPDPNDVRRVRVLGGAAMLIAAAMLTFVPWRATNKYLGFRGMRADVRAIAADPRLTNALVLVRGKRHPDFASAVVYNDLDLHSSAPVFAWDRDPVVRDALLRQFAKRAVWLLDGPSVTGGAYRLRAGPLSDADVRALDAAVSAPDSVPASVRK